jgi:hypothetical protein
MRGRLLTGTIVLALSLGATLAGVPAAAEEPAREGHPPAPERGLAVDPRLLEVTIELSRTTRKLEAAERDAAVAQQRLSAAQATIDIMEGFIRTNRPTVELTRAEVRHNALIAYQRHATAVDASIRIVSADDLGRADEYLGATHGIDRNRLALLQTAQEALERAQLRRIEARDQLATAAAELDRGVEGLRALRTQQEALMVQLGAVPVMGDAWLTPEQLAAWYRSTGQRPELAPGTTIEDLAGFYIEEGNAEHVRGDLAFAQGIVESAYFSVAAGNNYAGIGACDSCSGGFGFASPREGVRAQIQLLRNYADPDSRADNLAFPPVKGLYPADPVAAARTFDAFFLKGTVPLWNQMGNGNWATDPTYAGKVIGLFARIVAYTAAHRG